MHGPQWSCIVAVPSRLSQLDRNQFSVLLRLSNVRRYRELLKLAEEEREELTRQAQSRALPAGDVFRARLVLALASGKSYGQIETELQTSRPTIARWKQRFEVARLEGLKSRHQGKAANGHTGCSSQGVAKDIGKAH